MKLIEWIQFLLGVLLWVFVWNITDQVTQRLKLTDNGILIMSIVGIIVIAAIIQMNGTINVS
jgi:vacuolar-type H+-ATPase subunit I/STV1